MKLTVSNFKDSDIPGLLGICASDTPSICRLINNITQRLLFAKEVGEEGWHGSYAQVALTINSNNPFITTPREVARLSAMTVCSQPIRVQNQWFEYLDFGMGLQKQCSINGICSNGIQAFDRGVIPTSVDMPAGSTLRAYLTNSGDDQKHFFFEGTDQNGMQIITLFGGVQRNGVMLTFDSSQPFVETTYRFNTLLNVAKDVTLGAVNLYAVDAAGNETLLQTFAPNQTTGCYRRYFLQNLPSRCFECNSPATGTQVTAIAQLEFIPVTSDTDFLIIGNLPALRSEAQAFRYEGIDSPTAKQESAFHHKLAIGFLNGESVHYNGKRRPALEFKPFGRRGSLENARINML